MARRTVPYEDILYQDLQDPEEAAAYLTAALDDESGNGSDLFVLALRDVAKARGIRRLAQDTQLSRESLYRTLSRRGNPRFSTRGRVGEPGAEAVGGSQDGRRGSHGEIRRKGVVHFTDVTGRSAGTAQLCGTGDIVALHQQAAIHIWID